MKQLIMWKLWFVCAGIGDPECINDNGFTEFRCPTLEQAVTKFDEDMQPCRCSITKVEKWRMDSANQWYHAE